MLARIDLAVESAQQLCLRDDELDPRQRVRLRLDHAIGEPDQPASHVE
ncbi:MAG: hypothetical protein R3E65_06120 [Steroidobacteraceae bacterium]